MKKFVSAVFIAIILFSCSKKDMITSSEVLEGEIFFKNANIAIADVKGTTNGQDIKFQFNSLYEKNVVKMEVMSGPYENMLCFFHEQIIPSSSNQKKTYSITEKNAGSEVRFYVIKYTLHSGSWILTPAFKYQK